MKRAATPLAIPSAMAERDLTFREMGLLVDMPESTFRRVAAGLSPVEPRIALRIAHRLRRPVSSLFAADDPNGVGRNTQSKDVA